MIYVKLDEGAYLPKKGHSFDAAFDLASIEDCEIWPGMFGMINTGVHFDIPKGYYGQVLARSGLAVKQGIIVMAGVIDCTYRDAVRVVLLNAAFHKREPFVVKPGDRIAQIAFVKIADTEQLKILRELDNTTRGVGGFGSTGVSS